MCSYFYYLQCHQTFRPSIPFCLASYIICIFLYIGSSYYSTLYTLIPGSVLLGVASGPIWVAIWSHIVLIAKKIEAQDFFCKNNIVQYSSIFCHFSVIPSARKPCQQAAKIGDSLNGLGSEISDTRSDVMCWTTKIAFYKFNRKYVGLLRQVQHSS